MIFDANAVDNDAISSQIRCTRIGYDDMAQHFLLSTAARTLSLAKVMRMSDDEAFDGVQGDPLGEH